MAKTNNNSLKLQRAVRSLFYDYQEKKGCLGTTYAQAACGCDNALQMWRGPKGDKGDQGPQGPKGDNAGSFLVSAEFVVNPAGQPEGSYLKLVLIDVAQQEQVVYVNLSELEDVYSAGNGIDITSMVIAVKLGAGLTFDQQGNITSAYQFCDGLDETSNVVKVKLDASNNILGFAGSGCKGLTATVGLAQSSSGVNLVLTGANGAVLNTIPLNGGTGITIQKDAQGGGFTWLVDFSGVISSTAGNNLTISDNKLYVGNSTLSYTVGDGTFTLTNAAGGTSTVTLPTVVRSLDRADLVCEGENAPYLRLTFKRDNGQNLYQDVSLACLASALDVISGVTLDIDTDDCSPSCEGVTSVVPEGEPILCSVTLGLFGVERYGDTTEDNVQPNDTTIIYTDHGEASITTGDLSNYYALSIEAAVLDCCSIHNANTCTHCDIYVSSIDSPPTWTTAAFPIPIDSLISEGSITLSLHTIYDTEPIYGDDKIIVTIIDNQNDTLTLSFKIRKSAIEGCFIVPGLPEPYTANPGIVLSGAISVNGTFILGQAHTGGNRMDEIQGYSTELNSFTVTNSTGSDGPVDITLMIDGARSDDFWNYYRLSVPSWTAFVAAGEAGLPMEESCDSCGYYYEGDDLPPVCIKFFGKKMYLSCTDEGNNVYRLYPFVMPQYTEVVEEPEGLKADLVIVNAGGSETRVDMKPLLSQVGGSVVDAPVLSSQVVLTREYDDDPASGFATNIDLFATEPDFCDMSNGLLRSSYTLDDGALTFYVQGGVAPEYFSIIMREVDSGGSYVDTISYRTNYDYSNCVDIDGNISVDALVTTGVVIKGYDINTDQPVDSALYLKGERIIGENIFFDEDTSPGLTIRAYRYAGSEKVLRLGPSCSPDIPLADLGGISGASLDVQCETVPHSTRVPFEHFNQFDILSSDGDSSSGSASGTDSVFTVTVSNNDVGYAELSLISRSHMNADGDNAYVLSGPGTFEDLIANSPVLMTEQRCSQYSGIPCGLKVWVSCVSNGNSSYTFTFTTGEADTTESVLTTDLVLTDTGGNETRVDMKPLLSYVGGEFRDVADGGEAVPLIGNDVAGDVPISGFVMDWVSAYSSAVNFCEDGPDCNAVSTVTHDGVVDICYDSTPVSIYLDIYRVNDAGQEAEPGVAYTTLGPDDCFGGEVSPHSLIESYIAAGSEGLPLYRVPKWDYTAGELSDIRLVVTSLESENCYRFSVLQSKMVQKLCLGPSCDPCIDLTPAVVDCVTSVSGTVDCGGDCFPWPTDKTLYCTVDFYDVNGNHLAQSSCTVYDCTITGLTIPTGAASVHGELAETYNTPHRWYFSLPLTEGAAVLTTAEAYTVH